jgi:hypothetical protein
MSSDPEMYRGESPLCGAHQAAQRNREARRRLDDLAMLSRETGSDQWFRVSLDARHQITIRSSDIPQPGFVVGLGPAIDLARREHEASPRLHQGNYDIDVTFEYNPATGEVDIMSTRSFEDRHHGHRTLVDDGRVGFLMPKGCKPEQGGKILLGLLFNLLGNVRR